MSPRRLTFTSVVFDAEFRLLQLQARSMRCYLPPSLVAEIVIIDNSVRGMTAGFRGCLLDEYGALAGLVRILRPQDIGRLPGAVGWRSQQVLKLAVADLLTTDKYVVLDAKNIFVAEPTNAFFEDEAGRPRVTAYSYRSHPLRPALEHVLRYLGLDPAPHVDRFTATVTPFVLETSIVRELVAGIERRSGNTFPREFVAHDLTEFFLYSGWIIASGRSLDEVFDLHQISCPNVWPHSANLAGVELAIKQSEESGAPLFTVHRKALGRLDARSLELLADFWTGRQLFAGSAAAQGFLAGFRQEFEKLERNRRIRDLPHKARAAGRALRHRLSQRGANR